MIKKIEEIEHSLAKLEEIIKTLRSERDDAKKTAESLKKQLDDRELELLQLDEEMQNLTKRYEDELTTLRQDRQTLEKKLDSFSERVRELIPLLPRDGGKRTASSSETKNKHS